jgi:hypothetical protein
MSFKANLQKYKNKTGAFYQNVQMSIHFPNPTSIKISDLIAATMLTSSQKCGGKENQV